MTQTRHIVFDVGQVLIHWNPELVYRQLIPDADRRRWFFDNVCTHAWNREQDRGRSWAEGEAELIAQYPQEEPLIRAYRARWAEMIPHAYDDVVDILRGLTDSGIDVTMLTNFNDDTFAEARALYPFLDSGRGVTVSAEVHLLKPDRAIYDCHATTFGLDPAATLFIDDTQANVDGAIAAGWNAVAFQGAEKLKTDLAALGVAI